MDLATAKNKIINYCTKDHTKPTGPTSSQIAGASSISDVCSNDDTMEAVLKLLKDIESRVTALEQ